MSQIAIKRYLGKSYGSVISQVGGIIYFGMNNCKVISPHGCAYVDGNINVNCGIIPLIHVDHFTLETYQHQVYALQRKAVSRNRQNHTLAILSSRNINDFELWNAIKCHVTYVSAKRNHEACPQSVDLVWVETNNKQYIMGTLMNEYQTMFKSDIWIGETTQCYRSFRLYLSNMCCYLLSSVPMELHPVVDKIYIFLFCSPSITMWLAVVLHICCTPCWQSQPCIPVCGTPTAGLACKRFDMPWYW